MSTQTINIRSAGHEHSAAEIGHRISRAGDRTVEERCGCGACRAPGGVWRGGRLTTTEQQWLGGLVAVALLVAVAALGLLGDSPTAGVVVVVVAVMVAAAVGVAHGRRVGR